ncbi:MAG: hypothetical protein K0S41_3907, partial [Anaerocolumna sp.]|nr:hypothetical protein [Anaerocolumna sp.]
MYGMLAFIIFTFTLLAIVIVYEFGQYSNWTNEKDNTNVADGGTNSDSDAGEETKDGSLQ